FMFYNIFFIQIETRVGCHPLAIAPDDISFVAEIDGWKCDFFAFDVVPDIQFCPIGYGEYTYIFAFMDLTVEYTPQFGSLSFGITLTKFVPDRKDTFLCPGFFFVTAGTSYTGIKTVPFDGVQ